MKLSDFEDVEDLRKMKQACIDTRAKYDGYRDHQIPRSIEPCSLCAISMNYETRCDFCPWSVIEEVNKDNGITPCYNSRFYKQKAMTRRKRLDRWIKLIDEEIRRRDD